MTRERVLVDDAAIVARLGARSVESVVNGVRLRRVTAGAEGAPLVVLLHGFPDSWHVWRAQIPALAAAGHRVVALDMRGYGRSDAPAGVARYAIDMLADDVAGVIAAHGARSAAVVGHDWGGAVAWRLARRSPAIVSRLAILNAPHPVLFARALRTPAQARRSAYVAFFQLPWLPEAALRVGDFALLERTVRRDASPGALTDEDVAHMRAVLGARGALTAALSYYRAALRRPPAPLPAVVPMPPTLVVWGMRDPFLLPALVDGLPSMVPGVEIERVPDAGHWVQRDAPDVVNAALRRFLAARQAPVSR